jgi:hypothetical protein
LLAARCKADLYKHIRSYAELHYNVGTRKEIFGIRRTFHA